MSDTQTTVKAIGSVAILGLVSTLLVGQYIIAHLRSSIPQSPAVAQTDVNDPAFKIQVDNVSSREPGHETVFFTINNSSQTNTIGMGSVKCAALDGQGKPIGVSVNQYPPVAPGQKLNGEQLIEVPTDGSLSGEVSCLLRPNSF
jgi:hypothetical protein